jgi:DNA-binding MarR family transcriptional regulator
MNEKLAQINKMLVEVYDDVNHIEEYSIKQGTFRDLSITEIHTIEAVGLYGSKTMSEVAAELEITMGTLTTAVDKLIKKGYVERSRSVTDRRIVNVSLTKRGKLAYRIHEKFHLDMVQEVLLDFTPEEEEVLLTALGKLNRHLKEIYMGPKKETNNTLQQDDKWRAPK